MTTVQEIQVQKRDGTVVDYNVALILKAISAAFCEELGLKKGSELPPTHKASVEKITAAVEAKIGEVTTTKVLSVERIQDTVELVLMREGHYSVAKRYILYRENSAKARSIGEKKITVQLYDGKTEPFDQNRLRRYLAVSYTHL